MNDLYILPLFSLVAGAVVLTYLLRGIFRAVMLFLPSIDIRRNIIQNRQSKIRELVDSIEQLIDAKNYSDAARLIQEAFIVEEKPTGKYENEFLIQNNILVLEKAVYLLEATGTHFRNLQILEDELHSRASLLKLHVQAREAKKRLDEKKHSPESKKWAAEDLNKKMNSIEDQLRANASVLTREMQLLLSSAKGSGTTNEVTYH